MCFGTGGQAFQALVSNITIVNTKGKVEAAKHTYTIIYMSFLPYSLCLLGVLGQEAEDYCEQKLQELQLSFTKAIDQVTERMQADVRHRVMNRMNQMLQPHIFQSSDLQFSNI